MTPKRWRIRYKVAGNHVHCRLFSADAGGFALCGVFVTREGEEFESLRTAFSGAEFLPEED